MKGKILLVIVIYLLAARISGSAQVITTIAGTSGQAGYSGDGGQAINARFSHPYSIGTDNSGNLYVFDQLNAVLRKIDARGIITTIAGTGTDGFSGDGGPATQARISNKYSASPVIDNAGNIYFADAGNFRIRKISPSGIITTIAGNGNYEHSGDGGPASSAGIGYVRGFAMDNNGNLYLASASDFSVRKINSAGIITTIAGNGNYEFSGDGGLATAAGMSPMGLATDNAGNIYIADYNANRIRKINSSGIITTVAGSGYSGINGLLHFAGDGGPATSAFLNSPQDVELDNDGNIYIADYYNHVIRKVDNAGIITTVAGNTTIGFGGDGGLATQAQLEYPINVAVDNSGNLYIPDFWDRHIIRKVSMCKSIVSSEVSIAASATSVCAGTAVTFTATPTNGGTSPVYQWKINDRDAGTNNNIFTTATLSDGDIVSCIMISSASCTAPVTSANNIVMTIYPLPVITLEPEITILPGRSVQLNPTVTGIITQYLWTPSAGLNNPAIADPVASPSITTSYNLKVISANGCEGNATTTVTVYKKIMMPNAFTPNADGKNDLLRIPPGTTFTLKQFSIYNRWGQVVFKTTDISKGWDGTCNGKPVDSGTYILVVSGTDQKKDILLKETVVVIR